MKLKYKILWFEDQPNEIKGFIDSLKEFINENGFVPEIEMHQTITEEQIDKLSDQLNSYNPYDIIIFDYDLGRNSENGLNIAAKLRSCIYTDMIFYSGKFPNELRRMLFDGDIDGVFVISRDHFSDELEPIVEDHIKKMSDINNMRGVSMSAVSEIELSLREIMSRKVQSMSSDNLTDLFADVKSRLEKNLEKKKKNIENLSSLEEAVNDHFVTTFEDIRVALRSLFSDDSNEYTILNNNELLHRVQIERNNLAHQKDEYTDDGKLVLHGRGGVKKEYDFDEFKRIRNELLKVKEKIFNHLDN